MAGLKAHHGRGRSWARRVAWLVSLALLPLFALFPSPAHASLPPIADGERVLLETTNLGETVTKYDWGADRPISLTHATQGRQYFHFDALGTTANLTAATRTVF